MRFTGIMQPISEELYRKLVESSKMSKFLIALLALDIGVSLSKVYIFTWKLNYLEKFYLFSEEKKYLLGITYFLNWQIHIIKKLLFFL